MKTITGCLALLLIINSASADTFQFLYLEANEGNASGGHAAVQFGERIFHYQYQDGLIRLTKADAQAFGFDYRFLQNRSIHVADIEAPADTIALLEDYFTRRYWEQDRQFKHQQALENDRLLLEWLLDNLNRPQPLVADKALSLPTVGLFYEAENFVAVAPENPGCPSAAATSDILSALRLQLQQRYGAAFLTDKLQALKHSILHLPAPEWDTAEKQNDYTFSQRYTDLLTAFLAVRVLLETRSLSSDACQVLTDTEWRLDSTKKRAIREFQQSLFKSAAALLTSTRPDWGHALMINLARLIVLEQTLQSGQWTFLDDFKQDAESISTANYQRQAIEMDRLSQVAEQHWRQRWQTFASTNALHESAYTDLEIAANRYLEWRNSRSRQSLRYQGQQPLPGHARALSFGLAPQLSKPELWQAWQIAQRLNLQQTDQLNQAYAYDLITRNCVTELFQSIQQALGAETEQPLQASIDSDIAFIPFMAFAAVEQAYPVSSTRVLPSFRQQALDQYYQREFVPWVFMRESNLFTANTYSYNPDDSFFIFFTDEGLVLRPLLGAFNMLAALGQSFLGLIRYPFDAGKTFSNGTRGLLMSLPELVFVNIRKGSYKFSSGSQAD